MKRLCRACCLAVALCLASCVPRPVVNQGPVQKEPGTALFESAENLFQQEKYPEAAQAYEAYAAQYPHGSKTASALMRLGMIRSVLGSPGKAREAYETIIRDFPDHPLSADAKVEILSSYSLEQDFDSVIENARTYLDRSLSRGQLLRAYVIVADAYLGKDQPVEALNFYLVALQAADEVEKPPIIRKMAGAIDTLNARQAQYVLERVTLPSVRGYALYRYGRELEAAGEYDKAVRAFTELVETLPRHEKAAQAREAILAVKEKARVDKYAVGVLLPLTGPYRIFGEKALRGVELALAMFAGRNPGAPFRLVIKDTGSSGRKAAAELAALNEAKVSCVVGPLVTAESAAVTAQQLGLPMVAMTQRPGVPEAGDFIFRNFFTPEMQVEALAGYVVDTLGLRRLAVLYPRETYGETFMDLFWTAVAQKGAQVVGVDAYNPEHTDFKDPIMRLVGLFPPLPPEYREEAVSVIGNEEEREAVLASLSTKEPLPIIDFDALFIPDSPKLVGMIAPQIAFHDIEHIRMIGTNLWHSRELVEMAGAYIQGAVLCDGYFAGSEKPVVREFQGQFTETYGESPGFVEAVAYDTARMLFSVVARPEVRSRKDVKDFLLKMAPYPGVTGATRFDERGEAIKDLYLLTVKGSRFVELPRIAPGAAAPGHAAAYPEETPPGRVE